MKLYAVTYSPFVARVRLAIRIKGIDIPTEAPAGGTRTDEYLAINPIGKLPVLVSDDDVVVAESETIVDWIDARYPDPPLIPDDPATREQMQTAVRTAELYVVPAVLRLFRQMDPARRHDAIVAAEMEQLRDGLALVERFVDDAPFAVGGAISKADCIVLPTLILADLAVGAIGEPAVVAEFPRLSGYRDKARRTGPMAEVWTETMDALAAYMALARGV